MPAVSTNIPYPSRRLIELPKAKLYCKGVVLFTLQSAFLAKLW